jgi:hypothetical protein
MMYMPTVLKIEIRIELKCVKFRMKSAGAVCMENRLARSLRNVFTSACFQ